ncbi:glycosyltransferase family 2 protein [Sphingobacterium deserti]|uniref:Putative glycosyltransferase YibD n=1 Tax=Sphingobacterium deserti TaxID=1229276 RepID=A0A0B8T0L5_9SPHI|nr:glycosyltransferase [Sphingobacterium deserti]KGE14157.1 putative glycosyltransferase YibD [Sphingobacterium deserti]
MLIENSNDPLVSIIVPVYNAEATLPDCLRALAELDYPAMELLFVNDSSTDGSLALLESFIQKFCMGERQAKIVSHATNQGVAAARNSGLEHATGMYIYYVDADDSLAPNAVSLAVNRAQEMDADMVGFNWFLTFDENERKMNQPAFQTAWEALEKMMLGTMRWNLWLFLVKRSLYEQHAIRFTPGMNMGEDLMVMVKLFCYAQHVAFIDQPLYRYRQSNSASLTKTYAQEHIAQVTQNVNEVEIFLKASQYAPQLGNLLEQLKLNIKLPLLISAKTAQYKLWRRWFPEANAFVWKNKALPWRTRFIQYLALKKQFWLLKIYYYFVIRFVYGVIYR